MRTEKYLRSLDGADGGAPSAEVLQKENAELKAQLAAVKKPGALTPEQEKFVRERVQAGLTREQAVGVLQAQQEWETAQAKAAAPVAPAAKTEGKK